jgi:hypothetical protein
MYKIALFVLITLIFQVNVMAGDFGTTKIEFVAWNAKTHELLIRTLTQNTNDKIVEGELYALGVADARKKKDIFKTGGFCEPKQACPEGQAIIDQISQKIHEQMANGFNNTKFLTIKITGGSKEYSVADPITSGNFIVQRGPAIQPGYEGFSLLYRDQKGKNNFLVKKLNQKSDAVNTSGIEFESAVFWDNYIAILANYSADPIIWTHKLSASRIKK